MKNWIDDLLVKADSVANTENRVFINCVMNTLLIRLGDFGYEVIFSITTKK